MFASVLYTAVQEKDIDKIIKAAKADFTDPAYRKVYEDIKPLLERRNDRKGTSLKNLGGYCVDTLTIALWGLQQFDRPLYGMLGVISLGGDTDTNAAVYGQLAGAYYGYEALPKEWRENVYLGNEIKDLADRLSAMEECPIIKTRF